MAYIPGVIDRARSAARNVQNSRRDLKAMKDELDSLGLDTVLGDTKLWVDADGNPTRDISQSDFKEFMSAVDQFNEAMKAFDGIFYRIAS